MSKRLLQIIVGVNGALIMVIEVVGSRMLAPYAGGSTFVWTSLIGIILAALSIGYWQGGKLADKAPKKTSNLSYILLISGVLILTTALFGNFILRFVSQVFSDIRIIAILGSTILFAPANFFMGMVTPVSTRLSLIKIKNSGEITGKLYAISTVGSIVGTFLAGFFLLAFFGVKNILILISVVLFGLSLVWHKKDFNKKLLLIIISLILLLIPFPTSSFNIEEKDSSYSKILIKSGKIDSRNVVLLSTGRVNQSAMFLDSPQELVFPYTRYFGLADVFVQSPKNILMIGGGGYSFPKYFLSKRSELEMDVVEIDPEVTRLAKKYFKLETNDRLNIFHEDARQFIAQTSKSYDVIFIDAYAGDVSIPPHLVTEQFVSDMKKKLNSGGVVLANIIGSIEGDSGQLVRSIYYTYKSVFPQVYLFPVTEKDAYKIQNIILVAFAKTEPATLKSDNPEIASYLDNRWSKEITPSQILTDDFAPVEFLSLHFQRWNY